MKKNEVEDEEYAKRSDWSKAKELMRSMCDDMDICWDKWFIRAFYAYPEIKAVIEKDYDVSDEVAVIKAIILNDCNVSDEAAAVIKAIFMDGEYGMAWFKQALAKIEHGKDLAYNDADQRQNDYRLR